MIDRIERRQWTKLLIKSAFPNSYSLPGTEPRSVQGVAKGTSKRRRLGALLWALVATDTEARTESGGAARYR